MLVCAAFWLGNRISIAKSGLNGYTLKAAAGVQFAVRGAQGSSAPSIRCMYIQPGAIAIKKADDLGGRLAMIPYTLYNFW